MHDLEIIRADGATAAVEVTTAADGETIAFWRLMCDEGRWCVGDLAGGWTVMAEPTARAKRLRRELPGFLKRLENQRIRDLRPEYGRSVLDALARDLQIAHAFQGGTAFPGSIYVLPEIPLERSAGWITDTGDPLAEWIGEFLLDSKQTDVRRKLQASGASERHSFVFVPAFSPAPFSAAELLMRESPPLPTIAPRLPPEITHVWITSFWSGGCGFRWSTELGWRTFT